MVRTTIKTPMVKANRQSQRHQDRGTVLGTSFIGLQGIALHCKVLLCLFPVDSGRSTAIIMPLSCADHVCIICYYLIHLASLKFFKHRSKTSSMTLL